ncbi:transmembrane protein 254 isoform X2 [Hoplias malabaricus]|uniref:transmembrane protein 254 isoform X2 n=1 Tax=Hoplias malabaricus TaxID=27720 RepID=UPI003462148C
MATSDEYAYFRRSSLFWIVTVTLSMGFYTVPYDSLGLLGSLAKHLINEHYSIMYKGWWCAWAIHVFEALVAMKVCSDKGIDSPSARLLWFAQTALFGFASLGLLLKYKPDHRSKQQ